MLTNDVLEEIIRLVLKESRIKWKDAWVDKIKIGRTKIHIYMHVAGENVKVILYRNRVKVRVYSRLKGLSISLQRIYERIYNRVVRMKEHEREEAF